MANLLGQNIGTNYKGILNLNTLNGNLSGTLQAVTDGDGNASPLQLSTTEVAILSNSFLGASSATTNIVTLQSTTRNQIKIPSGTTMEFWYSAALEGMRLTSSGNLLIGTTTDAGFRLDVNGTARVQDNTTIIRAQNAATSLNIHNSTNGVGAETRINLQPNSGTFSIGKTSTGTTVYKIIGANTSYLSNTTGDIAFLNDASTGRILMSAGGSSTAQMTLFSTGNVGINTTTDAGFKLDVNGTARVQSVLAWGSTNLFPMLKRNGAALEVRLADDSGFASLQVGEFRNNGNFNIYRTDGYYVLNYGNSGNVLDFNPSNGSSLTIRMRGQTALNLFYIKASEDRIGIGTDTPNASAILDISTTTKGFLPPRGSNAQMLAIATPATGLVFYDTTNNKLNVYDGTNWVAMH